MPCAKRHQLVSVRPSLGTRRARENSERRPLRPPEWGRQSAVQLCGCCIDGLEPRVACDGDERAPVGGNLFFKSKAGTVSSGERFCRAPAHDRPRLAKCRCVLVVATGAQLRLKTDRVGIDKNPLTGRRYFLPPMSTVAGNRTQDECTAPAQAHARTKEGTPLHDTVAMGTGERGRGAASGGDVTDKKKQDSLQHGGSRATVKN